MIVSLFLGQSGGGGTSLPSQTGNAGKFLTTDGTNLSWAAASVAWGAITGNIDNQADLQDALFTNALIYG